MLVAAFKLLLPLLAMQFTGEVIWNLADFIVAGTLLIGAGLAYVLAARKADNIVFRAAIGIAPGTALLLIWVNLAIGVIGKVGWATHIADRVRVCS